MPHSSSHSFIVDLAQFDETRAIAGVRRKPDYVFKIPHAILLAPDTDGVEALVAPSILSM